MNSSVNDILAEVLRERLHQDAEWGGSHHDDQHGAHDWIAILNKHVGRAVIWPWTREAAQRFRKQMVVVAALAVAAIEWVDRALTREEIE